MSTNTQTAISLILVCLAAIGVILLGVVLNRLDSLNLASRASTGTTGTTPVAMRTISAVEKTPTPPRVVSDTRNECWDSIALMTKYCAQDQYFDNCWTMIEGIETILRLQNKTAIFASVLKLEPQTGPIAFWAVDHADEFEDSHLNLDVAGTADYFNNSAYFYSHRMHRLSVDCGGWSITYWKDPAPRVTRAIQLSYCELSTYSIRVCGSFDLIERV